MTDDPVRLSMIGQIVRRRWRLLAVAAAVGALLGAGASVLLSPGYETSTSVLLQGPREPDELLTEAQVAMSSVVLDRAAGALAWDPGGTELLRDSVSAEVADGNVIKITATAESPERAQQLADQVADEYVMFSTQLVSNSADASAQVLQEQRDKLRQQVAQTNDRITELHGSATQGVTVDSVRVRTELEALRAALNDAIATLNGTEAAASRANMVVMGPAERPTNPASPTLTQFVAGGAVLFFLLGVLGHLIVARADRRVRSESEIAAALGSTIVASVDVPDEPPAEVATTGATRWRTWLRWLVRDDRLWHVPEVAVADDDLGRDIRYRRALARLRDGSDRVVPTPLCGGPIPRCLRVLVLVAHDDTTAQRAAARLAVVADAEPYAHRTVLRVVDVAAGRPTVPDGGDVSGVLVVVTTGTRTGWELVGIAEACAEAGHEVVGVVVTHRARPLDDRQAEPTQVASPEAAERGDAMAGSA